jgi:hypothetical protein
MSGLFSLPQGQVPFISLTERQLKGSGHAESCPTSVIAEQSPGMNLAFRLDSLKCARHRCYTDFEHEIKISLYIAKATKLIKIIEWINVGTQPNSPTSACVVVNRLNLKNLA